MSGEARLAAIEIAKSIANYSQKEKPICLLWGGETTVTLKGSGRGGRNMEVTLAALIELEKFSKPFVLLCAGTDGTDGPTDAAGAIISNESWQQIEEKKVDPVVFLDNNDSYTFFEKTGGLLKTGPTGTNVMDIVIALIG